MAQPEENGVNSNTMIPEIHSNTHSTIHRPNKIQKLQIPTQFQDWIHLRYPSTIW